MTMVAFFFGCPILSNQKRGLWRTSEHHTFPGSHF